MNEREVLFLNMSATHYGVDQVDEEKGNRILTVGELKKMLEGYDDDVKIYIKHEQWTTYYGGLTANDVESEWIEDEDDDDEEEDDE